MTLRLSLACFDYDRTAALRDGSVVPRGIELVYLALPVEETFHRMLRHREFDVAEMSLSSFALSLLGDDPWLVAIPVFPSRAFRHSGVFVHARSGIERPEDLRGKVVGVAEYQLTANVWIRGILAEHHGVPVESVAYRTARLEQPERAEKLALDLPAEIDLAPLGTGRSLSDALAAGEIDALYTPRAPSSFMRGDPRVARSGRTRRRPRRRTSRARGSSRSCTRSSSAASCTSATAGWRGRCSRRSPPRATSRTRACARPRLCRTCCRSCRSTTSASSPPWAMTSGRTASSPTATSSRRSCATTTSRGSPAGGSIRASCSSPRRSTPSPSDAARRPAGPLSRCWACVSAPTIAEGPRAQVQAPQLAGDVPPKVAPWATTAFAAVRDTEIVLAWERSTDDSGSVSYAVFFDDNPTPFLTSAETRLDVRLNRAIGLAWNASTDESAFDYRVAGTPCSPLVVRGDTTHVLVPSIGTDPVCGLVPGTTASFSIWARDALDNDSAFSNSVTVTVAPGE